MLVHSVLYTLYTTEYSAQGIFLEAEIDAARPVFQFAEPA